MIDSHMHINKKMSNDIKSDIAKINVNSNIECVINVGIDLITSIDVVNIAKKFSKFYATVGFHPMNLEDFDLEYLYELASEEKVVAIGEVGIDFLNNDEILQKKYLIRQICLANQVGLPVIIHANNTNRDVIEVFEKYAKPRYGCVFHCFQPDLEVLDYLVKNNYYISFAGKITYLNAKKSIEVLKKVPNELFLVETDSPYFSPEPFRDKVNHTNNLNYIIEKIANVKNMSYEEVEKLTSVNAKSLFKKIK